MILLSFYKLAVLVNELFAGRNGRFGGKWLVRAAVEIRDGCYAVPDGQALRRHAVSQKNSICTLVINRSGDVSGRVDKDSRTSAALCKKHYNISLPIVVKVAVSSFFEEYWVFSARESYARWVGAERLILFG